MNNDWLADEALSTRADARASSLPYARAALRILGNRTQCPRQSRQRPNGISAGSASDVTDIKRVTGVVVSTMVLLVCSCGCTRQPQVDQSSTPLAMLTSTTTGWGAHFPDGGQIQAMERWISQNNDNVTAVARETPAELVDPNSVPASQRASSILHTCAHFTDSLKQLTASLPTPDTDLTVAMQTLAASTRHLGDECAGLPSSWPEKQLHAVVAQLSTLGNVIGYVIRILQRDLSILQAAAK